MARRALALGALWLRSQIEVEAILEESRSWAEAEAERTVLLAWLRATGLHRALSGRERPLLEAPVGVLTPEALVDATWRVEALAPLLWALGLLDELPSWEEEVQAEGLLEVLPLDLGSTARTCEDFSARAGLREPDAIQVQRALAQRRHQELAHQPFSCEESHQRVSSLAFERLYALNWLCGLGRCWDETPVYRRQTEARGRPSLEG